MLRDRLTVSFEIILSGKKKKTHNLIGVKHEAH